MRPHFLLSLMLGLGPCDSTGPGPFLNTRAWHQAAGWAGLLWAQASSPVTAVSTVAQ